MSFTITSTNSLAAELFIWSSIQQTKKAAYGFGRKWACLKFLLPRISSNNQNKQVSPIEQGDNMTVWGCIRWYHLRCQFGGVPHAPNLAGIARHPQWKTTRGRTRKPVKKLDRLRNCTSNSPEILVLSHFLTDSSFYLDPIFTGVYRLVLSPFVWHHNTTKYMRAARPFLRYFHHSRSFKVSYISYCSFILQVFIPNYKR